MKTNVIVGAPGFYIFLYKNIEKMRLQLFEQRLRTLKTPKKKLYVTNKI